MFVGQNAQRPHKNQYQILQAWQKKSYGFYGYGYLFELILLSTV